MSKKPFLYFLSAIILASLACSINVNIPTIDMETGPTRTEEISVPATQGVDVVETIVEFGAGKLILNPGNSQYILAGTARYNVAELKPVLEVAGDRVRIYHESGLEDRIPNFNDLENEWDLEVGTQPMRLEIAAGAYAGEVDLGGLAIQELRISDGAASSQINFSRPNQEVMSLLHYDSGASSVTLENLANANMESMIFNAGAGEYTLDFSGELSRDADIEIESGLSSLTIIVPQGVDAEVEMTGGLSSTSMSGSWEQIGSTYRNPGDGPTLRFVIELGAGSLNLRNN